MRTLTAVQFQDLTESEEVLNFEHAGQDSCQNDNKQKFYITFANGLEETVLVENEEEIKTEKSKWDAFTLTDGDAVEYTISSSEPKKSDYIKAMKEFKQHHSISGFFFSYQGEGHEDENESSTWGPKSSSDVDWTGIEEY